MRQLKQLGVRKQLVDRIRFMLWKIIGCSDRNSERDKYFCKTSTVAPESNDPDPLAVEIIGGSADELMLLLLPVKDRNSPQQTQQQS